jgi:hypothetical protein
MERSYLKEALESDNLEAGIQAGLDYYAGQFQSVINGTFVADRLLIVATMKILALAIEQKMDEGEKRMMQRLINQCICFDTSKMEEGDME